MKTYYKISDSGAVTYHGFRGDYGLHNRPTTQAIGKIMKKFEETEVVKNIYHFAENIAIVSESVAEDSYA